jgi:hypothetical protein
MKKFRRWFIIWICFKFRLFLFKSPSPPHYSPIFSRLSGQAPGRHLLPHRWTTCAPSLVPHSGGCQLPLSTLSGCPSPPSARGIARPCFSLPVLVESGSQSAQGGDRARHARGQPSPRQRWSRTRRREIHVHRVGVCNHRAIRPPLAPRRSPSSWRRQPSSCSPLYRLLPWSFERILWAAASRAATHCLSAP